MLTGAVVASRPTACAIAGDSVHCPEGRGGERDEETRMLGHGRRGAFTAEESGTDKLEGVACMEAGARRADGFPAVAASDGKAATRLVGCVVVVQHGPGGRVDGGCVSGEVNGAGASSGGFDLFEPAAEAGLVGQAD